ncbi:MAG: hypothetical protein II192_06980 [Clostridia bacterium]|nr:hypothetical protein [Clostridia bacterium]
MNHSQENPFSLDGVTLAYIGDCVMELYVREKLVKSGIKGSRDLTAASQKIVMAAAQAQTYRQIEPLLDEEEAAVFKRGRNCGHLNFPKHAKMSDYRIATGLEALLGYLYLAGRYARVNELLETGCPVSPLLSEEICD